MQEVNERIYSFRLRLMDNMRQASFALWGALLTVNALMVTAAAIVASPETFDRIVLTVVVVLAIAACSLLVICFLMMQNLFDELSDSFERHLAGIEQNNEFEADQSEVDEKADEGERWKTFQKWSLRFTVLEVILLLLIVLVG